MSKFTKSIWGGLLFSFWMMCFVFPISLFLSYTDNTPISDFLQQQVVDFFVLWLFCGVIVHGVLGLFEDLNKRRRDDDNDRDNRHNRIDRDNRDQRDNRIDRIDRDPNLNQDKDRKDNSGNGNHKDDAPKQ